LTLYELDADEDQAEECPHRRFNARLALQPRGEILLQIPCRCSGGGSSLMQFVIAAIVGYVRMLSPPAAPRSLPAGRIAD
jgi:hypothetical protein